MKTFIPRKKQSFLIIVSIFSNVPRFLIFVPVNQISRAKNMFEKKTIGYAFYSNFAKLSDFESNSSTFFRKARPFSHQDS